MLGVDRALIAPDAGRGPEPGNALEVTASGRGDSCEAGGDDTCAIKPFAGSAVDGNETGVTIACRCERIHAFPRRSGTNWRSRSTVNGGSAVVVSP